MEDELETKLKKVLKQISDLAPEAIGAGELLRKKAYERKRARGIAFSLVPLLLIALFLAVTAFPVFAGQENLYQFYASRKLEKEVESWNSVALGHIGEEDLAQELGMPLEKISALRASGYGYGEIVLMAKLAQASGKDLSQIQEMREKGLGWGRIATELGVSWQGISQKVAQERENVQHQVKSGGSGGPKQEKPEKTSPPGQQGPPENRGPQNSSNPTILEKPSFSSKGTAEMYKEEGEKRDALTKSSTFTQSPWAEDIRKNGNLGKGNPPGTPEHLGKGQIP